MPLPVFGLCHVFNLNLADMLLSQLITERIHSSISNCLNSPKLASTITGTKSCLQQSLLSIFPRKSYFFWAIHLLSPVLYLVYYETVRIILAPPLWFPLLGCHRIVFFLLVFCFLVVRWEVLTCRTKQDQTYWYFLWRLISLKHCIDTSYLSIYQCPFVFSLYLHVYNSRMKVDSLPWTKKS